MKKGIQHALVSWVLRPKFKIVMSFSKNGYEVVRNVFSKDLLYHLKTNLKMIRDVQYFYSGEKNKFAFSDSFVPKAFSQYALLPFETLSHFN